VLAEKPLAFTIREVEELEALAEEQGVVTQVGYMKMFDPLLSTAEAELGQFRGIKLVRITVAHPAVEPQVSHLRLGNVPRDADPESIRKAQAYDLASAAEALPGASDAMLAYYSNILNGSVIHEFSLLRALGFELPNRWEARLLSPIDGEEPPSLLAHGQVGETAFVLNWNWLPEYPEYDEELVVLASNARMEFNVAKPYILEARSRLKSCRFEGDLRKDTEYVASHETGFLRQLDAFADAIITGKKNQATFASAKEDIAQLQVLARAVSTFLGETIGTEA
jgi:predicted dehydrogenase